MLDHAVEIIVGQLRPIDAGPARIERRGHLVDDAGAAAGEEAFGGERLDPLDHHRSQHLDGRGAADLLAGMQRREADRLQLRARLLMAADEQEFIELDKLRLPPKNMRWGGPRFRDDKKYIQSGKTSVQSLVSLCGLSRDSRLLDVGCGQGRLLTGIFATFGGIREYVGLDVHKPSTEWASSNLANGQ